MAAETVDNYQNAGEGGGEKGEWNDRVYHKNVLELNQIKYLQSLENRKSGKLRVEKVWAQFTNLRDQLSHQIGFPCNVYHFLIGGHLVYPNVSHHI